MGLSVDEAGRCVLHVDSKLRERQMEIRKNCCRYEVSRITFDPPFKWLVIPAQKAAIGCQHRCLMGVA